MLRGVIDGGTATSARLYGVRGTLAGKTGTTDDRRDSWFAGYSSDRATVVWVGYDDNQATRLSGSTGALPLWSRFTARAEPHDGWAPIAAPAGFVTVEVDPETGLLATPYCPRRTHVELPDWRAPLRSCDAHLPQLAWWQAPYDATTGLDVSETLTEYIARSSPRGDAGRLHSDVTRVSGEGADIRIGRGPGGETPVEIPQAPRRFAPARRAASRAAARLSASRSSGQWRSLATYAGQTVFRNASEATSRPLPSPPARSGNSRSLRPL